MKIPKGVTAREFVKALEADGFTNTRTKGSHHFFQHTDGRATTVSYGKGSDTFPIGTLKGMISDVSWTENDLRRLIVRHCVVLKS